MVAIVYDRENYVITGPVIGYLEQRDSFDKCSKRLLIFSKVSSELQQ